MAHIHIDFCPVCGSHELRKFKTVKDYSITMEEFELERCSACQFVFTQDQPDQNEIGRFYASEEYISHSDTQKGLINKLYHRVRSHMLTKKQRWIEKNAGREKGRLLDVGCGTGYFAHHMQENGWDVLGLEPDETARKVAKENFGMEIRDINQLFELDGPYDVISLWHVLEHVHQLNDYMDHFHKILADDGILLIAVPNHTSADAEKYQSEWAAYDVPRHLWHFSPSSMKTLLSRHHFEIVKKYGMAFDPFYVSMLSEKYKDRSLGAIRGGIAGLQSNLVAMSNVDRASSVIYISRKSKSK